MHPTLLILLATAATASPTHRLIRRAFSFNIPASTGVVNYAAPQQITGTFDGGLKTYGRSNVDCSGQSEGGEDATVFILASGATLKNAIIGENQAEGVYCEGSCTIESTFTSPSLFPFPFRPLAPSTNPPSQTSGGPKSAKTPSRQRATATSWSAAGGARGASDKVIQHNGFGTVTLDGFKVQDFGALYRSCGNCDGNGEARNIVLRNVQASGGDRLVGINTNFGDKATITGTCATNVEEVCLAYEGTMGGGEPTEIGSCANSTLPTC